VLSGALVVHGVNLVSAWNGYHHGSDIQTHIAAARDIFNRLPLKQMQIGAPEQFLTGERGTGYPPSTALLLAPWVFAPEAIRLFSWLVLQDIAIALSIVGVYVGIGRPSRTEAVLVLALVLMFLPVREGIFEGALGNLLTLLMVASMLGLQRGRQVLGGAALGIAIALKLTPALLLPYFLWRRGYRLVVAVLGTALAVFAGTLVLGWFPRWPEWWAEIRVLDRGTGFIANQSINGFLLRWVRPSYTGLPIPALPLWINAIWYGAIVIVLAYTIWSIRRLRLPRALNLWTEFSLLLLALPLTQPFAWFHHHAGGLVAIVVAVRLAKLRLLPDWSAAGLVVAFGLISVAAYPFYRAARQLTGSVLARDPILSFGSSIAVFAVLIALYCLSRAYTATDE
jgi:hypothetical protein